MHEKHVANTMGGACDTAAGAYAGEMAAKVSSHEQYERERAVRNTPWEKASIEQKLDKLRMVSRDNQRAVTYALRTAREALELAKHHQHNNATGEVLKRAVEDINRLEAGCASDDVLA